MLKLLLEPYPHAETYARSATIALITGLFVALFLMYFQPFGIAEAEWHSNMAKLWLVAGYGLVTFVTMSFTTLLLPRFFPKVFSEADWTILKEIALISLTILLITLGNTLYSAAIHITPFSLESLTLMFAYTVVLGIFPAIVIVLVNYIYHLKLYHLQEKAIPVPSSATTVIQGDLEERFFAENEKDSLTLASNDLLYIESSDNYCTIYFMQENKVQKIVLRSSLSRLEQQVNDTAHIVRCHRSYMVNLQQVRAVSGNAQGYKFHLCHDNLLVPVARKNAALVEQFK